MSWTHVICEGPPDCPGKVIVALESDKSSLVVYSDRDSVIRSFPCSLPALLGVQRGTRTHLASEFGECVLSKEADGVWVTVTPSDDHYSQQQFFIAADEFLIALTKLVEARAVQRRVSLQ
jgi:hypothetical protein